MKRTAFQFAAAAAVLCLAAVPALAAVCSPEYPGYGGRECAPTSDNCSTVADVTTTVVQVGGEGSVGTEDECSTSPAKDGDGNIVEADLTFEWDRDSATHGILTLTAVNKTCDPSAGLEATSKITTIWFNTPASIGTCVLKSATLDGLNVCGGAGCTVPSLELKKWVLGADAVGEGCLGSFDWQLDTSGVQNGVGPDSTLIAVLDCAGASGLDALTSCDIATDGSTAPIGSRIALAAMHFQTTDPPAGQLSNKVSSNCQEPQYVELASFTTTPDDGAVVVEWSTMLEVDNAGFQVTRRNLLTGEASRLTPGLIPAAGDIYQGASYRFADTTAINGVEYEYVLSDLDLRGGETTHPGGRAVPNPRRPAITLLAPDYGTSGLRSGDRPTFRWTSETPRRALLQISSDPTFASPETLTVATGPASTSGSYTLNPAQARRAEGLALMNQGVVYWRILERTGRSVSARSATHSLGYQNLN